MKVAILADGVKPFVLGGMQKHTSLLIKYLLELGEEVILYHGVPNYSNIPDDVEIFNELDIDQLFLAKFSSYCVKWPSMFNFPGHYIIESHLFSNRLLELFKLNSNTPDVILAKGFSALAFFEYSSNLKIPIISHLHGYEMYQHDINLKGYFVNRLLRIMSTPILKKSDFLISYGGGITRLLLKLGIDENRIIENASGVDENWVRRVGFVTDDIVKIVYLGRFERRKGIQEINDAIALPIENAEFHFIGPIPKEHRIEDRKDITYYGTVTHKEELLSILDKMDVLLCPSYSEGLPNVIMEGMSRGLAIISTNVGAVEVLVGVDNGWIIEVGKSNEIRKIIQHVTKLNTEKLNSKKKMSIEKISHRLWPNPAIQLISIIKERVLIDV